MRFFFALMAAFSAFCVFPHEAYAWPTDIWASWLPSVASPVEGRVHYFHDLLMTIITAIVVFVIVLLFYIVWRYRRGKNPVPSKLTHNVPLEIVWTLIPCVILLVIMWVSLPMLYYMDKVEQPDVTLKVTGYQWYWGYSYPELDVEEYSLYMIPDVVDDPKGEFNSLREHKTYQRLLSTYELGSGKPGFVVLPVEKNIRVLMTAGDVIHAFALPSFGVKKDAVPGRLNETWINIDRPGIYYGQCSELCGVKHGFMPIEVRAVTQEQFDAWVEGMKTDSVAAFEKIQAETEQYAHAQVVAPKLTIPALWQTLLDKIK